MLILQESYLRRQGYNKLNFSSIARQNEQKIDGIYQRYQGRYILPAIICSLPKSYNNFSGKFFLITKVSSQHSNTLKVRRNFRGYRKGKK